MASQKYSVNQHLIETILSWVKSGEIAIPEIQRPFVWDTSKVRDLMDSLYQGFPVGYVIAWRNPNVKLKDGTLAEGKKVLIDGQQRITALRAAIVGEQVINQHYKQIRIKIAFQPLLERFEVVNPAILKDKSWIHDISPVISGDIKSHKVAREYLASNPEADEDTIYERLDRLCDITKKQIGLIELAPDLDIETDFFKKMKWLKDENDDLYDPSYSDMLRVAFTSNFNRGKLSDLVSLLSGRNFELRTYEKEIEEQSFKKLGAGIQEFMNETSFKRFSMIIRSTGFIDKSMIRSRNALNFSYILYLKLKRDLGNNPNIESWVRRWFVMSLLTGRYSGSPESMFDRDIKSIDEKSFDDVLMAVESAELSDAFWDVRLVQNLTTSSANSVAFKVYLAAQVNNSDKGFLSKEITVRDMIMKHGDIHHVFPRNYLKKNGFTQGKYNQVANFVYLQQEINIKIGDKEPALYIQEALDQCESYELKYGAINDLEELRLNLEVNSLPTDIILYNLNRYEEFLQDRRIKMASKIKKYYKGL